MRIWLLPGNAAHSGMKPGAGNNFRWARLSTVVSLWQKRSPRALGRLATPTSRPTVRSRALAVWQNVRPALTQSELLADAAAAGGFAVWLCVVATSNCRPNNRAFLRFPGAHTPRLRVAERLCDTRAAIL